MSLLPPLPPTFDAALRDATSSRPEARLAAAASLASPPPGRALEAARKLADLAADPVGPIREAAVGSLGALAGEGDTPAFARDVLVSCFGDPDMRVRQAAVRAASAHGATDAVRGLLADARPEMRFQAVQALTGLEGEDVGGDLVRGLQDPDAEVRAAAARGLGELTYAPAKDTLAAHLEEIQPGPRREAALALARLGDPRAIPVLRQALADPAWTLDAAEGLASTGAGEAAPDLARIAGRWSTPLLVRAAAGAALAASGDPRGQAALVKVLRAWRSDGRTYAVERVGSLALDALVPELVRLSERPRGTDPVVLARALATFTPRLAHAARALERFARRDDEAGLLARTAMGATLRP